MASIGSQAAVMSWACVRADGGSAIAGAALRGHPVAVVFAVLSPIEGWFVGSSGKHHPKSVIRLRNSLAAGIALTAAAAAGWAIIATGTFSAHHSGAHAVRDGADFAYQAQARVSRSAP